MVGGGDGANAEPAEGDGSGFAVEQILRSFKRRGTSFYIVKWAGFEERTIEPYGFPYSKKSFDPPPRDGVRPLAFFRVAIVQGSS